jgi:hypothetical protein
MNIGIISSAVNFQFHEIFMDLVEDRKEFFLDPQVD